MKSPYYVPELIEDGDILFNKNSDYLKQKKQEKKNPIFKNPRNQGVFRFQSGEELVNSVGK